MTIAGIPFLRPALGPRTALWRLSDAAKSPPETSPARLGRLDLPISSQPGWPPSSTVGAAGSSSPAHQIHPELESRCSEYSAIAVTTRARAGSGLPGVSPTATRAVDSNVIIARPRSPADRPLSRSPANQQATSPLSGGSLSMCLIGTDPDRAYFDRDTGRAQNNRPGPGNLSPPIGATVRPIVTSGR